MQPVVYEDWERLGPEPYRQIKHRLSNIVFEWHSGDDGEGPEAWLVSSPLDLSEYAREDLEELREMACGYARLFCGYLSTSFRRRRTVA